MSQGHARDIQTVPNPPKPTIPIEKSGNMYVLGLYRCNLGGTSQCYIWFLKFSCFFMKNWRISVLTFPWKKNTKKSFDPYYYINPPFEWAKYRRFEKKSWDIQICQNPEASKCVKILRHPNVHFTVFWILKYEKLVDLRQTLTWQDWVWARSHLTGSRWTSVNLIFVWFDWQRSPALWSRLQAHDSERIVLDEYFHSQRILCRHTPKVWNTV